jgi:replicative DNA helicase
MTEHERVLLGQIIVSRGAWFHELSLEEHQLFTDSARHVWKAITSCIDDGAEPDLVSIADKVVGVDKSVIAGLTSDIHATSNWPYYQREIINAYRDRRLKELAEELQNGSVDDRIERAEETLSEIQRETASDRVYHRGELIHPWIEYVESRYHSGGDIPGYSSGFAELDRLLMGWQDRLLYYVGARPSGGKSALILQFADYLSLYKEVPVGIISLESSAIELQTRTIQRAANLDGYAIQMGTLRPSDFQSIQEVGGRINAAPSWVYDVANQSIHRVTSVARYMVRRCGVKCLFVDYVQLIRVKGAQSRREQVEAASIELKALARELNVPVIAAAQLRREVDQHKAPGLGDFQHSSQLEQDADGVILLHDEESGGEYSHTVANIAKNRAGQKGSVSLYFNGKHMRFAPLEIH